MMPWICWCAVASAPCARARASLLSPIRLADLAVEAAHGVADLLRGLAGRFGEVLHFARDHGEAAAGDAGARRLDGRVERQQIGLLARSPRSSRRPWQPAPVRVPTEPSRASMRPTASTSSAIWLDRGVDRGARLRDLAGGRGRGRLNRLRCVGDVVVGRDHRLGGLLQVVEPLRLARDAAGDFLRRCRATSASSTPRPPIAVGKLIDEPLGQGPAGLGFNCKLHDAARASQPCSACGIPNPS